MSAPRVLALFAHPDDAELLCGGTLALLADLGWRVHLAAMSPGDLGSPTLDREAIAAIRREEGRQAAALLRGAWHCLEARDLSIFFCDELCRRATALIRQVAPDVVLTHCPTDYLADHEETARIVAHACFAAPVRLYAAEFGSDSEAPPTVAIAPLYYADPLEQVDRFGQPVPATLVVDVESTWPAKELLLQAHLSQREWLRRQHSADDPSTLARRWAAVRGATAGLALGEGFRPHHGHAFPRTGVLEKALGRRVRTPANG
ncbi:MAG: PIG-L family deacetylase [Planctomycetes bacterium]|nr:PIG-L family deacetylase [Planctomycetota bacterium]